MDAAIVEYIGGIEVIKAFNPVSYTHLDVYKRQGFTQGAFYGYYPDKAALFEALVSEPADGLMEQFKACLLYTSRCV